MFPQLGGEQVSFVKACQDFFTKEPYGKKLEIAEFKALTKPDRVELRGLLILEGYNVAELPVPVNAGS